MNPNFQKFLETFTAQEYQKRQIPRLKVIERERKRIGDNRIRSGSSLSFVSSSSSVESNPIPLAGEKYSSMCENEKQKVRTIIRNWLIPLILQHRQH